MSSAVERLEPGLVRFRLVSPTLAPVNVYAMETGAGWVLFDSGFTYSTDQLCACLAELGVGPAEVAAVFYTHTHEDHMGGGVSLGDAWGCPQYVWEGTRPAFENYYDYYDACESWRVWLGRRMAPSEWMERLRQLSSGRSGKAFRQGGDGLLHGAVGVAFGEAVTVGGRRFRCEDARGHDPFHCVWHDEACDRLVTGDIVLGLPTPLLERIGDNMTRYRATLQRWQQAPEPALILPGHGRPSVGLGRALERSLGYLEAGYALTVGFLEAAEPVEPLGAVLESFETLGVAQFQVAFIRLANTMSQLDEMALAGLVEQREDLRWRRTGPLPAYADYLPLVERL